MQYTHLLISDPGTDTLHAPTACQNWKIIFHLVRNEKSGKFLCRVWGETLYVTWHVRWTGLDLATNISITLETKAFTVYLHCYWVHINVNFNIWHHCSVSDKWWISGEEPSWWDFCNTNFILEKSALHSEYLMACSLNDTALNPFGQEKNY